MYMKIILLNKKQKIVFKFTHTVFLLKKQSVTNFLPSGRTITPLWECTFSHNRLHAWGTCNHGELFNWVKYCVNNSNSCYDSMNWRMYNNILALMFMVMVAFSSLRCGYSAIIVAKPSGLCRIYTRPSVLDFTFLVTVLPGLWAFLSQIKFPLRPRDQLTW